MMSDRREMLRRYSSALPDEVLIDYMTDDDLWRYLSHLRNRITRALSGEHNIVTLTRAVVLQVAVDDIRAELMRRYP